MNEQKLKQRIEKRQSLIEKLTETQEKELAMYYKTDPKVERDVYNISKEKIMSVVFKEMGVKQQDVFKRHRNGKVNRVRVNSSARQCYFYFAKEFTKESLKNVGRISLPKRDVIYDHSTVIHGIQSWQDWIDTDKTYRSIHKRIYKQLEFINKYNVN